MAEQTNKYYLVAQKLNEGDTEGPAILNCTEEELIKKLDHLYNLMIKRKSSDLVGWFVYDSSDKTNCIAERINPKYLEVNGKSTSRILK